LNKDAGVPSHIQVKKSLVNDNRGFIEVIPGVVFAVIISYVYLNVGTFMTGALGSELVTTFATNSAGGTIDESYYNNATKADTNVSRNTSLTSPCNAANLHQTNTKFWIRANDSGAGNNFQFNLTVNGVDVNNTATEGRGSDIAAGGEWNCTVAWLIANSIVSASADYVNFTWNISKNMNRVAIRVVGDYHRQDDYRTTLENNSVGTLENLSENFDDNVDIIKIAITISVLLVPIMAIMTMRRFI